MSILPKFAARALSAITDKTILGSFDRPGFKLHQQLFKQGDLEVDLEGRVCLVTGANSGLGRATALGLARRGAEVYLLCRSEKRGKQAEEDIRLATSNNKVHLELVDVSLRSSILEFAHRFGDRQVDVLVNNAGVLPNHRRETEEGLELTWATNVMGPFLLTWKLAPNLARAAPGRVINVSSGGMFTQRLSLRDVDRRQRKSFDGVVAYAQTKRAEVILSEMWAQRLSNKKVTINSMHPGWADTPSVRASLPRFWRFTKSILRTPAEGADTILWLAICESIEGRSGEFWFDRRSVPTHLLPNTRERPQVRRELWQLCRKQAGIQDQQPLVEEEIE